MRTPCLILIFVILCDTGRAQTSDSESGTTEEPTIVEGPSDKFRDHLWADGARPNVNLPPHIEAKDGELTLIADFAHSGEDVLPLYLVNRTDKEASLASQDHDLYVRLEYLDENGLWVRAQIHRGSWCGNSYYPIKLPPGQHFQFTGYRAAGGKPAKVRYRSATNRLVSNVGDGFYLEADRKAAALDDMAAGEIPYGLAMKLRAGDGFAPENLNADSDYLFALDLLSHFSESEYYRNGAARKIEELGEDSPVTPKIREFLARDWPAPGSVAADALVERCLESIERDQHSEFCWSVISPMLGNHFGNHDSISRQLKPRIAAAISISLDRSHKWEAHNAAKIIAIPEFTSEFINDESLLKWLRSEHNSVVLGSANALAARGKIAELVQIGSELPEDKPFLILKALASGGKGEEERAPIRQPGSEEERRFWEQLLRKDPGKSVQFLPRIFDDRNPYNRIVHGPIKDYLEQVAAKMGNDPVENEELYEEVSSVVRFFGTWQMPENIPVLQTLLKHPQYVENKVYSSRDDRHLKRYYLVRREARTALIKMGIPVDPDIVLEEKFPLPAKED